MRLTMAEKRVLIKSFAPRYRRERKKVKGEVVTEFTRMTGYNQLLWGLSALPPGQTSGRYFAGSGVHFTKT